MTDSDSLQCANSLIVTAKLARAYHDSGATAAFLQSHLMALSLHKRSAKDNAKTKNVLKCKTTPTISLYNEHLITHIIQKTKSVTLFLNRSLKSSSSISNFEPQKYHKY